MNKRLVGALWAILAAFSAVPATAADLLVSESAIYDPAPAANWTGFYAGGFVGYHAGTVIEYECAGLCSGNFPLNGAIGGLQAGYDYQFDPNWVIGGFVQLPLIKPTGSTTLPFLGVYEVEPQWAFTAGARVGYATDAFLPYAFLGVAVVNNKVTNNGIAPTATHIGLSGGVGLEYKVTDNWSIDGRYTYTTLGGQYYDWGVPEKYGENAHNFTLGVNYRF